MFVEILLFVVLLAFVFNYFSQSKRHLMPPGPWEIPYYGNKMVSYDKEAKDLQWKYGDIFMTKFGVKRFVYLTDFKIAKEVLSRPEFASRPNLNIFQTTQEEIDSGNLYGVFLSNGPIWIHNRRFLLRHLRDLGMGKSHLQEAIMKEAEDLILHLSSTDDDHPHEIPFSLNLAVLNVLWQLIAGHRYELNDKKIEEFVDSFRAVQETVMNAAVIDFFPMLTKLLPESILNKIFSLKTFVDSVERFNNILKPFIQKHKDNLDTEEAPVDLMGEYLLEMTEKKSEEESHLSESDLLRLCYDMFVGGMEPTSNTIRFIILYLTKFQSVQEKLQEEIDHHVSKDQLPSLEDRPNLAYVDAVIAEVSRHCSFTSFGLLRTASEDTTIKGYYIPKDTIVMSVASFSQMDPRYWTDPETFNPSRFLDENGKFKTPAEGYQPFGLGRRQCLGESLAKIELFILVSALFQSFHFDAPSEEELSLEPKQTPFRNKPNLQQKFMIRKRK